MDGWMDQNLVEVKEMGFAGMSIGVFCLNSSSLSGRRRFWTLAKKKDFQEKNEFQQQSFFPLKVSKANLVRAAVGVFGLGFIDAGYSGDWSRIGVITPQSEELLRHAAFLVVPLCIFFIFSQLSEQNS